MLLILSPSKTLDYETPYAGVAHTQPELLMQSQLLVEELKTYSSAKLAALMEISDNLATLNAQRYRSFSVPFTPENARQAILAFKGDVYNGVEVERYKEADFAFAQAHVRILSGLYGLLRPLDLMQPYRLEMGTELKNPRGKDLYAFWGERITHALHQALSQQENPVLINLASVEYFKAVRPELLGYPLIHITFKERKGNQLKVVGLFAKKARGDMANYIITRRIDDPQALKRFRVDGYKFEKTLSTPQEFVFVRR